VQHRNQTSPTWCFGIVNRAKNGWFCSLEAEFFAAIPPARLKAAESEEAVLTE
jgi:hypothetical protein